MHHKYTEQVQATGLKCNKRRNKYEQGADSLTMGDLCGKMRICHVAVFGFCEIQLKFSSVFVSGILETTEKPNMARQSNSSKPGDIQFTTM